MKILEENTKTTVRFAVYAHIFSPGILICTLWFLPYLADYYLLQPDGGFLHFYLQNVSGYYYGLEAGFIYFFAFAVWFFTKRTGISICAVCIPTMLLAYAGSIKYEIRGELFHLDDLKLTEAAGTALHFLDFKCTYAHLFSIIAALIFCAGGIFADKFCKKYPLPVFHDPRKQKYAKYAAVFLRIAAGCFCIALLVRHNHEFSEQNATPEDTTDVETVMDAVNDRYVLYNFLKNDKLAGVTVKQREESYRFFQEESVGFSKTPACKEPLAYPSVIVIMNESWWNTDNISGNAITFSPDPMLPFKELTKTCSFGYLTSNVSGGGTIDSESEFLTGLNTKYFVPDAGISNILPEQKIPSLVDYFNALDYDTTAIHPYYGSFYDREKIYANYGFDHVIFDEDMDYTDLYTRFISDESLVNQIIKEYEEKPDDRKFIFSVSIANHTHSLDYKKDIVENYPYPVSVTINDTSIPEKECSNLINTFNGIYLANKAFAQLKSYFEKTGEPVVLVMFGDHIPAIRSVSVAAMGLSGKDDDTMRRASSVPILMWSNCNTEKISFSGENISYLSQMLLEYADLPETEMTQILRYERSILKTNSRRFVTDANGNPIQTYNEEQTNAIRHFKNVEYDILFRGNPEHPDLWLPLPYQ